MAELELFFYYIHLISKCKMLFSEPGNTIVSIPVLFDSVY